MAIVPDGTGPFDLLRVLRDEARAIHGTDIDPTLDRSGVYGATAALGSAALCLSGGGIRSAAFCLGIIQQLGSTPLTGTDVPRDVRQSLLGQFHYLSTVSGGGYAGSWLSLWIHRAKGGFFAPLIGRPGFPDDEPRALAWLRANSNYLTPKLGLTSADTWAAVALTIRNLVLNWLVIIPVLLLAVLAVKALLIVLGATALAAREDSSGWGAPFLVGEICLFASLMIALQNRPTAGRSVLTQGSFIRWVLAPSVIAAYLFAVAASSSSFFDLVASWSRPRMLTVGAALFAGIYAVAWVASLRPGKGVVDFLRWTIAGACYGTFAGFGVFGLNHLDDVRPLLLGLHVPVDKTVTLFIYGVPWLLTGQLTAEMIFVGLTSYQPESDNDREWFGRSAGWFTAVIVGWIVVTVLAVLLAHVLQYTHRDALAGTTLLSGGITALLGKSSLSPAIEKAKTWWNLAPEIVLSLVTSLFLGALVVGGSVSLDRLLLKHSLLDSPLLGGMPFPAPTPVQDLFWLAIGTGAIVAVGVVASLNVNINRFSLHALYRNRLVRAFLGASRPKRDANPFDQFDPADNALMADLWGPGAPWRPFHVINIALNIVSTRRLAWQERKAESFTVSPLHAGSFCKAYRPTHAFGGANGITLGTAMAVSGAAVSPNMGYHSSAATSFLMALLNVRLGWWFGNPGPEGEGSFRREGPRFAVIPLLMEAFGLTTDDRAYVYLSDGGHFENLGLYEMVRRRCRSIVVVDAGYDPHFAFEDLGNAVRKASLDLGIRIDMQGLAALKPSAGEAGAGQSSPGYHATGTIHYPETAEPGRLLYVKPALHGTESASVRSYAAANPKFPHQPTLNQWFSESQFESYRALGFEIMGATLARSRQGVPDDQKTDLPGVLAALASAA